MAIPTVSTSRSVSEPIHLSLRQLHPGAPLNVCRLLQLNLQQLCSLLRFCGCPCRGAIARKPSAWQHSCSVRSFYCCRLRCLLCVRRTFLCHISRLPST